MGWNNNAYKTITITGGTDATNSDLIAWLQANATQQTSGNQYEITETLTNLTSSNKTIQITPDTGYYLPSSITVTNGTLVSYNSTTGVAVISGDNAVVTVECSDTQTVSGYSGNITSQYLNGGSWMATMISFTGTPDISNYYAYAQPSGFSGNNSYTNQTKVYVSGEGIDGGGVVINGVTTLCECGEVKEITLNGDYNIILLYNDD